MARSPPRTTWTKTAATKCTQPSSNWPTCQAAHPAQIPKQLQRTQMLMRQALECSWRSRNYNNRARVQLLTAATPVFATITRSTLTLCMISACDGNVAYMCQLFVAMAIGIVCEQYAITPSVHVLTCPTRATAAPTVGDATTRINALMLSHCARCGTDQPSVVERWRFAICSGGSVP